MVVVAALFVGGLIMTSAEPSPPTGGRDEEPMSHDEAAEIVTQDETLQAAGSDNDEADAGTDEESRP